MNGAVIAVTVVVRDYDEAIAYYTGSLGFEKFEDQPQGEGRRWVLVGPAGAGQCRLLLAKAKNARELSCVGNQTGGRVFLFLRTSDFERDYAQMKARGVKFLEEPRSESYGRVAVFEDLYGNRWDLIGPAPPAG